MALTAALLRFGQTQFTSDGFGALIGATSGQPGALISIGTGIGALKLTGDGYIQGVSSWGFPAGDAGSGAWIGLRFFGDFLKALDGINLQPEISDEMIAEVLLRTGDTPQQIMQWQREAKPKDFASLVPIIVKGAGGADPYCTGLLKEAAAKISRVGGKLVCAKNNKVYLAGGLAKILKPYCRKVAPDIDWVLSTTDPIKGIFQLASGQVPAPEYLVRPGLKNAKN